jgi:hypothetical protein
MLLVDGVEIGRAGEGKEFGGAVTGEGRGCGVAEDHIRSTVEQDDSFIDEVEGALQDFGAIGHVCCSLYRRGGCLVYGSALGELSTESGVS